MKDENNNNDTMVSYTIKTVDKVEEIGSVLECLEKNHPNKKVEVIQATVVVLIS